MSLGRLTAVLALSTALTLTACDEMPAEPGTELQAAMQSETAFEGLSTQTRPGPARLILGLADDLGLTESQRSAIHALEDEHRHMMRTTMGEVRDVLTEEQSDRLREILAEGMPPSEKDGFPGPRARGSGGPELGPGPNPMLRVLDLTHELELTPQQIAELEAILAELQERGREIRQAIIDVLTPAQLDRLKELIREGRGRMGGPHGGP